MRRNLNGAVLTFIVTAVTVTPVFARGNDLIINDGFGEQVTVKNGFFGTKTKVVKDRLGDGYAVKKGLLGQDERDVNILGNSFHSKTGILGGTDIKGQSMFGDHIETKKGVFGRRTTYVDVSGGANVIHTLWEQNKSKLLGSNANGNPLGVLGGLGGFGSAVAKPGGVSGIAAPNSGVIQPPSELPSLPSSNF